MDENETKTMVVDVFKKDSKQKRIQVKMIMLLDVWK